MGGRGVLRGLRIGVEWPGEMGGEAQGKGGRLVCGTAARGPGGRLERRGKHNKRVRDMLEKGGRCGVRQTVLRGGVKFAEK